MYDIKPLIKSHLLDPLKYYPTVIQDTMIEIIADKLQELHDYAVQFPEIISPDKNRMDILKTIADQFLFTIREDADIQEQIDILENILYVYRKRGSIDTIENMWKYYGGNLPRDVEVVVPSYNLFRFSVSEFSGTHTFINGIVNYVTLDRTIEEDIPAGTLAIQIGSTRYRTVAGVSVGSNMLFLSTVDGLSVGDTIRVGDNFEAVIIDIYESRKESLNRPGYYEIKLTNNTYPIPELKEFLMKELVAAGNLINFTNSLHSDISSETKYSNPYYYKVLDDQADYTNMIQLSVSLTHIGLTWSGLYPFPLTNENTIQSLKNNKQYYEVYDGEYSIYSGQENIFIEFTNMIDLESVLLGTYNLQESEGFYIGTFKDIAGIEYSEIGDLKGSITGLSEQSKYKFKLYDNTPYDNTDDSISTQIDISIPLHCTAGENSVVMINYLVDDNDNPIMSTHPGYFVLGESLLGEEVI